MPELIVHTLLQNGDMLHDVQSDNLARLKQTVRTLQSLGYQVVEGQGLRSGGGFHAATLWSLEDRVFSRVSRRAHTALLRTLRIPVNQIAVQTTTLISTYATVPLLRTRRRRTSAATSPVLRLFAE